MFIFLEYFSHFIHLYFAPWPIIDNPTSSDKIMYSTLMCFHPRVSYEKCFWACMNIVIELFKHFQNHLEIVLLAHIYFQYVQS
jgi:hypothetical protein